jgi:hypothetical protein
MSEPSLERSVWGAYPNYQDVARFDYGRRMWRLPEVRARLLAHWTDPRHPYHRRFREQQHQLEQILSSDAPAWQLDQELRARGASLRSLVREIPPVFGSFF